MGAAQCKGCSNSDPISDTVKVGPVLLGDADGGLAAGAPEQQKEPSLEEQRLRREAEEQKVLQVAAEEERQKREAEEERRRLQAQVEEQARLERQQAEELERIAREEQERAAREQEAQEAAQEAARRLQELEEARLALERRAAAELKEAEEKVRAFLQARHFTKGIASAKKSCMKTSFPLHAAVEENSPEMVLALRKCGADIKAKNSAGLTPLALAQKLHKKKGALTDVLKALEN